MLKSADIKNMILDEIDAPRKIRCKKEYYISKTELEYILAHIRTSKRYIKILEKKRRHEK